ncbi:MAG TPA: hypothetical protein VGO98_03225 [Candidatus Saccharimonadales bacterium]|jgi:hypothetical protein|nr:hypothetical protein [Candidatus Saccharimonadales bacterium]
MEHLQGSKFTGEDQPRLIELKSNFIPHGWSMVQTLQRMGEETPIMQPFHSCDSHLVSGRTPELPYLIRGQEALPIEMSE